MICATRDLRRARVQHHLDQDLSWSSYLWGESWRERDNYQGVISQLMGRAALLSKLASILPRSTMPSLVAGIFMSKLMYAMQIYCHTWGLPSYRDAPYKAASISKSDVNVLQTLQNRALRCITGGGIRDTSTQELLKSTGYLSVHQLGAYLTITSFQNAIMSRSPKWVTSKVQYLEDTRTRSNQIRETPSRLNLREESYLPRAAKLHNMLPSTLKSLDKKKFKVAVKDWVRNNIPIRP